MGVELWSRSLVGAALALAWSVASLGCREQEPSRASAVAIASSRATAAPSVSADAADPCRNTALCALFGRCTYRPVPDGEHSVHWTRLDPSAAPTQAERFTCVASTDADCERSSVACLEDGACSARRGLCIATDDARCSASRSCLDSGLCHAVDGWCQLDVGQRCDGSTACRANGACSEAKWVVERIPDVFFASRRSLVAEPPKNTEDLWAEAIPVVETRTFAVANETANVRGCVALRSESCRASEVCREQGFCSAREGQCRP